MLEARQTRGSATTLTDRPTEPSSGSSDAPLRVVVAGAGVAGLEALVALRSLAGARVALTLVAPEEQFSLRALSVFQPFGYGAPRAYPLAELSAELGAEWHRDAVARVNPGERTVTLRSGGALAYDVLVLAVGAIPYPAFAHGVLFDARRASDALAELLAALGSGRAQSVAVVVPRALTWALPAYELAFMLSAFGRTGGSSRPQITVVTAEAEPLAAFGAPAAEMIREELREAGIDLICDTEASVPSARAVDLGRGRHLLADRTVHLPLLTGPRMAGVPYDAMGFIEVDDALRAGGEPDVYAVGDGTAGPYKQGGLAAQQADAVAAQIAERADPGSGRLAHQYRPVLRGVLRTGRGPRYLRAELSPDGPDALVADTCLWWPPTKVASRWLTPWLAARDAQAPDPAPARVLPGGGISRGSLSSPAAS